MDLLGLICSGIAFQEGWWTPDSRPQRNLNPGDLRAAPWRSAPQFSGGYWKAASEAEGIAGLYHQVALNIARGYSLAQLVNAWAPASDGNDPTVYLANLMKWTGITDATVPVWNLLTLTKPV